MENKYYLVKLDSYYNYYRCTQVFKAESEEHLRTCLESKLADDMYIESVTEVDFENNQEEILKEVNLECKMSEPYYRDVNEL